MSNSGKGRKVTVDLKSRSKLERGSVFHRLGNTSEERSKKWKDSSPEGKKKLKKHAHKTKTESDEKPKKIRAVSKSDVRSAPKKIKDPERVERIKSEQKKEEKERHSKSQKQTEYHKSSEHSKSHSKQRQNDAPVHHVHKMENLIIEKQVSVSPSPKNRSRSTSHGSVKIRKKSKKHSVKHSSPHESIDGYQRYRSQSPEPHSKTEKHKERGRSREPKRKLEKEAHRSSKTLEHDHEDDHSFRNPSPTKYPVLKKKSIKRSKSDKQMKSVASPEKKSKLKHSKKERSRDRDMSFEQVSSLTYDSSEEYVIESEVPAKPNKKETKRRAEYESREHLGEEEFVKSKKKKMDNTSGSPAHHKRANQVKSQSSGDSDIKLLRNSRDSRKNLSKSDAIKKKHSKGGETSSMKRYQKEESVQNLYHSDFSSPSKHSQVEYSEYSQQSEDYERYNHSDSSSNAKEIRKAKTKRKKKKEVVASFKNPTEDEDSHITKHTKKNVKRVKRKREERSVSRSESANEQQLQEYRNSSETIKTKKKRHTSDHSPGNIIRMDSDRDRSTRVSPPDQRTFERQPSPVRRSPKHDRSSGKTQQYAKEEFFSQRSKMNRHKSKERLSKHQQLDSRYSLERVDPHYHPKHGSNNLSAEGDSSRKSHEWQRSQKPRRARQEFSPRSVPSATASAPLERRSERSKFVPQRKMLEPDYLFPPHPPPPELFPVLVKERWGKGGDVRHSRPSMSSSLEGERGRPLHRQEHKGRSQFPERKKYAERRTGKFEASKYMEVRKYVPKMIVKPSLRHESKDHQFSHALNERRDQPRSDTRVSRSSSLHTTRDDKLRTHIDDASRKLRSPAHREIQSPIHHDRSNTRGEYKRYENKNASEHKVKRLDHRVEVTVPSSEVLRRHSRIQMTRHDESVVESLFEKKHRVKAILPSPHVKGDAGPKLDDIYRGRKGQRSLSRKRAESLDKISRRSGSSHSSHGRDRDLGHRKHTGSPRSSSSSRRERVSQMRDSHKSEKNTEKYHSVQEKDRKKIDEISDNELNMLMKREEVPQSSSSYPTLEVDWNDLPTQNDTKVTKEHDSILRNFSPYQMLMKTRVSMDLLPPHIVNQINELCRENENTIIHGTNDSSALTSIQRGLNSYTDERMRKRLLRIDTRIRHSIHPPRIINAKTYSASMKHYMCVTKIPLEAI